MWKTTLRGLRAHKLRFVSTVVAVVLGVAFMAGTLVFTDTVGKTFDDLFASSLEGVDVGIRGVETVSGDTFYSIRPPLPAETLAVVTGVEGVAVAEGYVEGFAQIVGADGEAIGDPGAGAPTFGQSWIDDEALNPWTLAEGRPPEGAGEVVIDRASATAGSYELGDTVTVLSGGAPTTHTLTGIVTWGEAASPLGASAAIYELPTAQSLLALDGQLTNVWVRTVDDVDPAMAAAEIAASLSDGGIEADVATGEALIAEAQSDLAEGLAFFNTFLLAFALIALFVGSFIIYNTFTIVVTQRSRELALLRAVGASRRQVLTSVLIEALAVAVIAPAIGLVAGIGLSFGLRAMMAAGGFDIPATGTVIQGSSMAAAFVTGFVITVVAALVPALRGANVPPLAALRDLSVDRAATSTARVLAGLVVVGLGAGAIALGLFADMDQPAALVGLGAAVAFVGVFVLGPVIAAPVAAVLGAPVRALRGATGRLAVENARRNPKRTAATAVALTIGVSLVGLIAIFAASAKVSIDAMIDDNVTGDLILTSGAFAPEAGFSPGLSEAIAGLPDVERVAQVRIGLGGFDDESLFYTAIDPAQMEGVVDLGVTEGSLTDLRADGVAVHTSVATAQGWSVGDVVALTLLDGTVDVPVVAIYERNEVLGPVVIGLGTHEDGTGAQLDQFAMVELASDADVAAVRSAVEDLAAPYANVEVQDLTEFKEAQAAQIDQMLTMIYALLALAVIIALIGIANTLTLSIHERTRELGLLRAVGMTRSQLRAAIRWESVIVALFGTLLGLAVGLAFGWALVAALAGEGFVLSVPAGHLAVITLLGALAGVIAGIRPAWRASRLDVLDAIATA